MIIMISHIYLSIETFLLLSIAALYIVHCPFNKVEESFNTQAVHDIVNLFPDSLPTNQLTILSDKTKELPEIADREQLLWDHLIFPGVVPRTFIGAIFIGIPLKLAKFMMTGGHSTGTDKDDDHDLTMQFVLQIGSRFALSSLVILSISAITRAIHKRYGLSFRFLFLITTIGQFHYLFYAGRFIPNTFAAILANLVFASWINRQYSKAITFIAFCVIIFRFDTAVFFGWLIFDGVFIRRFLPLRKVLSVGVPAGLFAMLISFSIDSVFWARPVLPELESIYFNVWLNKSHEWGIEPYFWYTYNCLPRILMANAPFILFADNRITRSYLIPILAFIITYSFLPHKELRFVLFVTPLLNICVTSGMMNIYYYLNQTFNYLTGPKKSTTAKTQPKNSPKVKNTQETAPKKRSLIATILFCLLILCVLSTNLFACYILSRISSHNYPGGQAGLSLGMTKELLDKVSQSKDKSSHINDPRSDVAVYVDNLAAQTGLSRFVQVNGVYYAKTPSLNVTTFKKSYSLIYLILEPEEVVDYLRNFCRPEKGSDRIQHRPDAWQRSGMETTCNLPNQSEMYCSILDSVTIFKSINIGGLLRKLRNVNSIETVTRSLVDDNGFIKTRTALHIIRCSTRSKSNPFSA